MKLELEPEPESESETEADAADADAADADPGAGADDDPEFELGIDAGDGSTADTDGGPATDADDGSPSELAVEAGSSLAADPEPARADGPEAGPGGDRTATPAAAATAGAVVVSIELLRECGKATVEEVAEVALCRREVARTALETLEDRGWVERLSTCDDSYYAAEHLESVGNGLTRNARPLHEHARGDLNLDGCEDAGATARTELVDLRPR